MDFFGDFGLRDTFQERTALKQIEIDIDKLPMKFLALNVDFDGLSLDFLGSRKPAHEGIKERYSRKSRYFTVVGQSFVKTAGDRLTVCEQELLWAFARLVSFSSNFLFHAGQ